MGKGSKQSGDHDVSYSVASLGGRMVMRDGGSGTVCPSCDDGGVPYGGSPASKIS
jgi:hypothetical protein